jgi:hypothetical protein
MTRAADAVERARRREIAKEVAEVANERQRVATALADPSTALRKLKERTRQRMRNLRDPKWGPARRFPDFVAGMSTSTYIALFQSMNASGMGDVHPLTFDFRTAGPAPWEGQP